MKTIIQDKLKEIEAERGIKILYACESGSRAWGFPSPDSDYDIRFIYLQPIEHYLSVYEKEKQIGFPIVNDLDVYGWDLKKVLQLIGKSNTTPFEWLQSPIVYYEDLAFKDSLWKLCQNYFDARSNIHHYLGIARGAISTLEGNSIKIKKMFYILRPLLAALWCVERKSIAPMDIFSLMELLPDKLKKKIIHLIELKSTVKEGHIIELDTSLHNWIKEIYDYCLVEANKVERTRFDLTLTDKFFREKLKQYDYTRNKR
jgi:predicted nucleotidyltransferase